MIDFPSMQQMQREWHAWQAVCLQLRNASASIDINEEPALHAALKVWGEELARLRVLEPQHLESAYEHATQLYNEHIGFLPY